MQSVKTEKDYYGETIRKIGVSRNLHTLKYETFLGNFDPDKKPIINTLLPDPSDKSYVAKMREMEELMIGHFSLGVILPFIFTKYPDLCAKCGILELYFNTVSKYFIPITDDRWDRSLPEWIRIISYAKDHGCRAASRKFFAIKNGKPKYLSPNYIKQKAKVFDKSYALWNSVRVKKCNECLLKIREILKTDRELQRILKKLYRQYFGRMLDEILVRKETYSYDYCYIRHYDPSLYKKQKSDFKKGKIKNAQVNGKIECGPFKLGPTTDVPSKLTINIMINLAKFMRKRGDL